CSDNHLLSHHRRSHFLLSTHSLYSFLVFFFFFFNDPAPTAIYTLSLHDALPIYARRQAAFYQPAGASRRGRGVTADAPGSASRRSEERTSELQSRSDLVCRLLLEKKKKKKK